MDVPPDASTAEVLGEEPGSVLVANVRWLPRDPGIGSGPGDFTGQPAVLRLTVVTPSGESRDVATLLLPTGMGNAVLGPTGYLALSLDEWEDLPGKAAFIHRIAVIDLRDPLGPLVARAASDSTALFSWSPSGQLGFVPRLAERRRIVFDPATGHERFVDVDLGCCSWVEWTADGSGWFATRVCDPPCDRGPGIVDTQTGEFRRTDDLPLAYPLWSNAGREYDLHGRVIRQTAAFDDMGKGTAAGQVITAPGRLVDEVGFDDPRATVWWDSRIDEDWWRWQGWDTDGEGILVVRSTDRANLELTRYGEPREPETIALLDLGAADPTSVSVVDVRDVSGRGKPDIVLQQLGDGPTWWFSGLTGRVIELGANIRTADTLETTVVLGWIED